MTDTDQLPAQKIYGRAMMDVLSVVGLSYEDYKEIKVNAKRKQSIVQGLTTIAKNVLDAVPISESWASSKILGEYERTSGRNIDMRAMEGCLRSLVESGLIQEPAPGRFRKPPEKPVMPKPTLVEPHVYVAPPKMTPETIMARLSAAPAIVDSNDPLTLISGISSKLRDLASDLDAAVLIIGESIDDAKSKSEKLTQLQQLLKGLA